MSITLFSDPETDSVEILKLFERATVQMRDYLYNIEAAYHSQRKIAFKTRTGLDFIKMNEIIRFEARANYTKIYLNNGQQLVAARRIKEYEAMLPGSIFCRIHNSHIIHLDKIKKYEKKDGGYVTMEDGSIIKIADRRRGEFMAKLLI